MDWHIVITSEEEDFAVRQRLRESGYRWRSGTPLLPIGRFRFRAGEIFTLHAYTNKKVTFSNSIDERFSHISASDFLFQTEPELEHEETFSVFGLLNA